MRSARAAEARLTREVSVGTKTRRARLVANEDTWKRCAEAETHRNKVAAVPNALPKELDRTQEKSMEEAKAEHVTHACVVEMKDTRKQIAKSRLQRARTVERLVT